MNLLNKLLLGAVLAITVLPARSSSDEDSDYKLYCELKRKCPSTAVLYVSGDKEEALNRAKELLPLTENINKKEYYHTFDNDLNMLKAVINGDETAVENYMENDYPTPMLEFLGFRVGLKEALRVHERFLALTAAKEGSSSDNYLSEGSIVAALLYAADRRDEAKSLAKKCLPLMKPEKEEAAKKKKAGWLYSGYDREESVCKGIIDDDHNAIRTFLQKQPADMQDSIGARLEEAYGKIYLYKRLRMDLDHLAFAYNYLGLAQAIAGNYDESERAYKMALREAKSHYQNSHPEILGLIRSDYAAMLKLSGRNKEADKMVEEIRTENLKASETKANSDQVPTYIPAPGWGP